MRFRNLNAGGALVLLLAVAVPAEAHNRGSGTETFATWLIGMEAP